MNDEPQLTPQQSSAIETRDVSIALSAGAGCGKTFVLTQRFLKHLAPPASADDLHHIVAITFTERAAREMRDRIREECRRRLGRCPPNEVDHWLNVVRGLDSARISTIHSFCASLLRAHAVDAGIDPQFGLLEESTGDSFLRSLIGDSVQKFLEAPDGRPEKADCMRLVREFGLERARELLRALVLQRYRIDFAQFASATVANVAADWLDIWNREFVPQLLRQVFDSRTVADVLSVLRENEPTHAEMQRRREYLLANLPALVAADNPAAILAELRSSAQVQGGGGKKAWSDDDVYASVRDGFTELRKLLDSTIALLDVDLTHINTAAELGLIALRLAQQAGTGYDTAKQECGLLDFDDLLLRTRDLLRDRADVRSRAAAGIRFLMVDEFQDTDPVQAEIVRLLAEKQLLSGKLFVVGDAKQSIYRFRRADPAVFHELRQEIPLEGRLPLSINFRSQPEILKFVNCLFAPAMGETYEALEPLDKTQYSPTPAIEFLFPSAGEAASDPPVTIGAVAEPENADARRKIEADWIARRVCALLHDSTPRIRCRNRLTGESELRPVRPGDVAILFRSLNNVALYEEALRRYGVNYYLVGGRAFFAQQEIFDVVNLCQCIDDPDDAISLAGVLRSPFFSLTDDTLLTLVHGDAGHGSLAGAIGRHCPQSLDASQLRQATRAFQTISELRALKDRLPIADLLNLAFERTGYDAALLNEFLGRRKLANLRKLADMARQYDESGLFTLKDFVVRLRESVSEQSDEELAATHPETSDVVKLMTIHQSKGLEFPVVVVADMNWRPGPRRSAPFLHPRFGALVALPKLHGQDRDNLALRMHRLEELPEDEAETARLLYVATTRAADYLILSACLRSDRQPASPWLKLLAERFDLSTGLPAGDPYRGRLSLGDIEPDAIPKILVHHAAPAVPAATRSGDGDLPVSEFIDAVEAAVALPLPPTLQRFPADLLSRRHFSVSDIEWVDARLRGVKAPSLPARDRSSAVLDDETAERRSMPDAEQFGTLVHSLLERVKLHEPTDLAELAQSWPSRSDETEDELQKAAVRLVELFLQSPVFQQIASAKRCFRELDFLLQWPIEPASRLGRTGGSAASCDRAPRQIAGVIDCLYESPAGKWHIIDYKTGQHRQSPTDENLLAEYELQLSVYALAVREFTGELPASIRLVMLQDAVRPVQYLLNSEHLAKLTARIGDAIGHLQQVGNETASAKATGGY